MFLKNYAKFTGRHLRSSVLLIKSQAPNLQTETLIRKKTPEQVFSCDFREIFENISIIEQLRVTESVTLTLLKQDFPFIMHFSPTTVTFQ